MRIRSRVVSAAACLGLLLAGCTDNNGRDGADPASETSAPAPETSAPDAALTLIADLDPAAAAISTSRALYDSSEIVVLADVADPAGLSLGASAAVALGVPLLLSPAPAESADPVQSGDPVESRDPAETGPEATEALGLEFERLGVQFVLAVGAVAAGADPGAGGSSADDLQTIAVPAEAAAVAEAIGIALAPAEPVATGQLAAAFADLDPGAPVALLPDEGAAPGSSSRPPGVPKLPTLERAPGVTGTVVLATTGPESLAAIATARAAGIPVTIVSPDHLDPRSSPDLIAALSESAPDAVIAVGAGYAAQQGLEWKIATATTGEQLPGGGQLLFPTHMFVALYGFTQGPSLGVLGEQDADAAVQRAIDTAAQYQDLVSTTVVPMFEIIATVASATSGADGNYSSESDIETLQPWVDAAGAAGLYVVLDLQPGRTDFLTQAQAYEPLLRLPFVGLALDPEWRLGPNEVHLDQIGSVSIEELNAVVSWLADLTRANALPQKLLVVHQFQLQMIQNRELLDTTREELSILIHVDGKGSQPDKQATWSTLHQNPPANLAWGWKNFIDEDLPMLTPEQTIAQVIPTPELITYQ